MVEYFKKLLPECSLGLTALDYDKCKLLRLVSEKSFKNYYKTLGKKDQNWIKENNFNAELGESIFMPDNNNHIKEVIVGIGEKKNFWNYAKISKFLPPGNYKIDSKLFSEEAIAISWSLENYSFKPYKNTKNNTNQQTNKNPKLSVSKKTLDKIKPILQGCYLARDLINLPANFLGPDEMERFSRSFCKYHKASFKVVKGEELKKKFPAIHMVGRASEQEPRLIDIHWGNKKNLPNVTLVGKGVTFDTGGLDIKSPKGMEIMKKDMGGAAISLGLAHAIISNKVNVNLRVLIPVVENSVSSKSMRPLDIIKTGSGIDVEIGNTDAEGRLILADAFNEAKKKDTDLLIDFATLTGAARIALGTELPVFFTNNDFIADKLISLGEKVSDPLWRLPLHKPYERFLIRDNGSLSSTGSNAYGGAITAALFLSKFIGDQDNWVHLDLMAWNQTSQPGRPQGGEAMSLRAIYEFLINYEKN